jgi:osmotically-inducible protein OsmY
MLRCFGDRPSATLRKGTFMKTRNTIAARCAAWTIAAASLGLMAMPAAAQEALPAPQGEAQAPAHSAQDLAVAERVRSTLMSDFAMEGIQLLVRVLDGTVELLGIARDEAQAQRAVALTLEIPGVAEVVHYIEIDGVRPVGYTV